jgi:DNA invertase Pin-like site-specific DNA recombinase
MRASPIDPQQIERAKTLRALGKSQQKIANELGVSRWTIARWLEKEDPDELENELQEIRKVHHERFIDTAWEGIHIGLEKWLQAIKELDVTNMLELKQLTTSLAIQIDKINVLEQSGKKSQGGTRININILPSDGTNNQPRIMADAVQVHDVEGEVLGDNLGFGIGEDVLRLPAGSNDGDELPGEPWSDNSEHIQES